jgi:hypothetical protein
MLQGVVNAGRSAEKRLGWDKQLTEGERGELIGYVNDGRKAFVEILEIRKQYGYDDESADKDGALEQTISADEVREIKVTYMGDCPTCKAVARSIAEHSGGSGWDVSMVDFNSTLLPTPKDKSGGGPWPRVEVNGIGVSLSGFLDLISDQGG